MNSVLSKMDIFERELLNNGFKERSERIRQKKYDYNEPFMIMIVGEGNFGKSTLINSLFGKNVAAVSRLPKTWKIDIYKHTDKSEEALLYYKNNKEPRTTSINEAENICFMEEEKVKSDKGWKSDLFQVKWCYNSNWQKKNILLVDTPGISQFRANTNFRNLNFFGNKGIKLESFDGFEFYFYRADFVFWCFKATKLEDVDTLNALKSISSNNKRIIGIITFMERIPSENWDEVKKKAKQIYGSYVYDFFYFSKSKDDTPVEVNETVNLIKTYIDKEIEKNLKSLKESSLKNFYDEEISVYSSSIGAIANIYRENFYIYYKIKEDLENKIVELRKRILTDYEYYFYKMKQEKLNQIRSIYFSCNENDNSFKSNIENKLLNKNLLLSEISFIHNRLREETKGINVYLSNNLKWQTLTIINKKSITNSEISIPSQNNDLPIIFDQKPVSINIDFSYTSADSFDIFSGGIAAAIGMFALGPIGIIAGAIGWLFGESKEDKIIRQASKEVEKVLDGIKVTINDDLESKISQYKNDYSNWIDSSFYSFNGGTVEGLSNNFYSTDSVLSNDLLNTEDVKYIDCSDVIGNRYLSYFPALLNFDSSYTLRWNNNATYLYRKQIDAMSNKIKATLQEIENEIMKLINDEILNDKSVLEKKYRSLEDLLSFDIWKNKLIIKKELLKKIVDSNQNYVYKTDRYYNNTIKNLKTKVSESRVKLSKNWDQKGIDIIWQSVNKHCIDTLKLKNSVFHHQNMLSHAYQCSDKLTKVIFSDLIAHSALFAMTYNLQYAPNDKISDTLIPYFKDKIATPSFGLNEIIGSNDKLKNISFFSIADPALLIVSNIQQRISSALLRAKKPNKPIENEYPNGKPLFIFGYILLLCVFLNLFFSPSFIEDRNAKENISIFFSSYYTIGFVCFTLIFQHTLFYLTRRGIRKDIKKNLDSVFSEYVINFWQKLKDEFFYKITI